MNPNNLNCVSPHVSFHFVLIDLMLNLRESILINLVLSKFIFNPEIPANVCNKFKVAFSDFSEPSSKSDVSSANCEILFSSPSIIIPLTSLLCLIL